MDRKGIPDGLCQLSLSVGSLTVLIILQHPVVFLNHGIQHCLLAFHICQGLVIPIAFCITPLQCQPLTWPPIVILIG